MEWVQNTKYEKCFPNDCDNDGQLEIAIWPSEPTFFELLIVENHRFAVGISMLSCTVPEI